MSMQFNLRPEDVEQSRQGDYAGKEYVCWTRMQSEAGQGLEAIVARKELERRAGSGVFFWGVGNAPASAISTFARMRVSVSVVFSIMKGRPRAADVAPSRVMVWRRYIDMFGIERELPPQALITSRGETEGGTKKRHYALCCYSSRMLRIRQGIEFDPMAYRNVSGAGAPVGASQVTALLQRVGPATATTYEANLTANLTGSYWVRLTDPVTIDGEAFSHIEQSINLLSPEEWLRSASHLRSGPQETGPDTAEPTFF